MNFVAVEKIAKAVLYEGYILYPYRPSSTKNRQRWNFGTLYPQQWAQAQRPVEPFCMVTECLVKATADSRIDLRVCFLRFIPSAEGWEQGIECWADQNSLSAVSLCDATLSFNLELKQANDDSALPPLTTKLSVAALPLTAGLYKLHLELSNTTPITALDAGRTEMLLQSMVSAHLLMGIENGEFVSLLDPPDAAQDAVGHCQNVGAFPVMVGEEGDRSMMLASPIILYDYPRIAPESTGDFFDGTEMDEMLALRIMTLTDEEKVAVRQGDQRARAILERTDNLPPEHWTKIHGAIRGMRRVPEDEI